MKEKKNIEPDKSAQKAESAFNELLNHKPLKASDDFYSGVMDRINNEEPAPAVIHTFPWMEIMKYAAAITIMVLNGLLAFQAISLRDQAVDTSDEIAVIVEDYFYDYSTLDEELE